MAKLIIIGAGQYGLVTKEIAETLNIYEEICFLDDSSDIAIDKIENYINFKEQYEFIVAIGNSDVRKKIVTDLENSNCSIATIISPYAYISKSSIIEEGCIIEPFALVNTNVRIEKASIICCGAIINHDSIVHGFCHINSGSIVKSNQEIPQFTKLDYGMFFEGD